MAHLVRPWIVRYLDKKTGRRVPKGAPGGRRGHDVTEKYVRTCRQRLADLFEGCRFSQPADITADRVLDYLAARRRKGRAEGGLSTQTANLYLTHAKQFGNFLVDRKVL